MTRIPFDRGEWLDKIVPRSPAGAAYGILGLCAEELRSCGLEYSAAAVTYLDSRTGDYRALASSGYNSHVLDFLLRGFVAGRYFSVVREASGLPVFWQDIPRFEQSEMVIDVLRPSGYEEGASVALVCSGRGVIGVLHMSFTSPSIVDYVRKTVVATSVACARVVEDQVALARVHCEVS